MAISRPCVCVERDNYNNETQIVNKLRSETREQRPKKSGKMVSKKAKCFPRNQSLLNGALNNFPGIATYNFKGSHRIWGC